MNPVICRVKQILKSAFLIFFSVFFIFVSSFRFPVKASAAATTAVTVGGVIVTSILTALGVGVAADAIQGKQFATTASHMWSNFTDNVRAGWTVAKTAAGLTVYHASRDLILATAQAFTALYPNTGLHISDWASLGSAVGFSSSVLVSGDSFSVGDSADSNYQFFKFSDFSSYRFLRKVYLPPYPESLDYVNKALTTVVLGSDVFNIAGSGYSRGRYDLNDTSSSPALKCLYMGDVHYLIDGYTYYFLSAYNMAKHMMCYFVVPDTGHPNYYSRLYCPVTVTGDYTGDDVINPAEKAFYAREKSAMNNPVQDVIDSAAAAQGVTDGIDIHVPSTVGDVSDGSAASSPAAVGDVAAQSQADTLGKDIATDADKAKSAENNKTNDRDTTPPKLSSIPDVSIPEKLVHKFPFCLPIDFVSSVKNLAAPAQPPAFTLPLFVVPSLGWDSSITLNWADFDRDGILSAIIRWSFSVLWIIGLIFVTKKLIWK